MTRAADDLSLGPTLPRPLRRLPLAPAEGWFTLLFVMLMSLTVAWSYDDAAWVLGNKEWGDFYAFAAILATLTGFATAKAGWPRWLAHLAGAGIAALVVPVMVGSILVGAGGTPFTMFQATSDAVYRAWVDLAIERRQTTLQTGHYLLVIGLVVWSAGQFAGYAVFGHRRPLDAVIVVGLVLLVNVALTMNEQLPFLVIFTIAGLCVLARSHAFDEEATWLRRRMGDAGAVRSIYLRGGAVFITAAVFGSLVLTVSASSAPLEGIWRGVDSTVIEWSRSIQRFLPFGGAPRPVGFGFGDTAPITGQWTNDDRVAVTIDVAPEDDTDYYWRAVAFDSFNLNLWSRTEPESIDRESGAPLYEGIADAPTETYARQPITFTVEVAGPIGDFVLSPLDPVSVSAPATVETVGAQRWFSSAQTDERRYTVTAMVPVRSEEANGLTANRLRAAGDDYPADLFNIYTALPDDAMGPYATALLEGAVEAYGTNPYDLASGLERLLKSERFTYDIDVRGQCDGVSAVECFAEFRRGYCLYYASTMAVLLREQGIPARLVEGYLRGERDEVTGVETIRSSAAHAWVEVYFPTFGWYPFDPTGGGALPGQREPDLAPGPSVTPVPSVAPSFGSLDPDQERGPDVLPTARDGRDGPTGGLAGTRQDGNQALLVSLAVLLLVAGGAVAFAAWRRGPRGEVTAEGVWRNVGRTAGRFGFGPRPQQTVYEYAGVLGDVLPTNRPELETVARAKVEVAYGRHELGDDARRSLRDAQRRLRVGLLRLALRRSQRRRPRR